MHLITLGHSHITRFHNGYQHLKDAKALAPDLKTTFIDVRVEGFRPLTRRRQMHQGLRQRLAGLQALGSDKNSTAIVSILAGAQMARYALAAHPEPYDFILPFAPHLPRIPDVRVLHYHSLFDLMQRRLKEVLRFLEQLRELTTNPIVQIEVPPPIQDNDFVMNLFGDNNVFKDVAIAPASLRYKWWRLHSEVFIKKCSELGIVYVSAPPDSVTPEGYLSPQAWGRDPFHGNDWYGERLFAHVYKTIQQLPSLSKTGAK